MFGILHIDVQHPQPKSIALRSKIINKSSTLVANADTHLLVAESHLDSFRKCIDIWILMDVCGYIRQCVWCFKIARISLCASAYIAKPLTRGQKQINALRKSLYSFFGNFCFVQNRIENQRSTKKIFMRKFIIAK